MQYVAVRSVKHHLDVGMVLMLNVVGPLKIMLNVVLLVYLMVGLFLDMIQQG